jgi:bacterioferritin
VRGDGEILEFLNEHLTAELTAVNQYFLDAKMLENWGLPGLAAVFRERSMEEMRDSEELIERILYFEGHPNLQRLDSIRIGESPQEMIELGLQLETEAIERLRRGVELAVAKGDIGTRELLAGMLAEEEEHADFFESQLEAIGHVGLQNYLARYAMPAST